MPILISHKNVVLYLEHCRIVSKDARVSYIKSESGLSKSFSIPHLNTSLLLLGPGTSITSMAAKMLASEGVNIGFTSGGGVPLFLASNSEYRPTQHLQSWIEWWGIESERLVRAKILQEKRIENVINIWKKITDVDTEKVSLSAKKYRDGLSITSNIPELLGYEANFTKSLYKILAQHYGVKGFKRETRGESSQDQLLDQGNYLAYGAASVALWGLGIPPSLAVIHGKTRRGALVFDIADVYKDAIVLPTAFLSAYEDDTTQAFRENIVDLFDRFKVLNNMFSIIKEIGE